MQDPIAEESYSAIKEKAKKQYAEIGHVWCPFLNENIYFTKAGFKHLIWKGARQRPKTEQKRRFLLLSFVKNIIESSDVVFKYERRGGADFWASTNIYGNKKITLILRQLDGQAKHFFSIFSDKQKTASKSDSLFCPPPAL